MNHGGKKFSVSIRRGIAQGFLPAALLACLALAALASSSSAAAFGTPLWTNTFAQIAHALAVDLNGNAIVAGSGPGGANTDYFTKKYSGAGAQLWSRQFNGKGDVADTVRGVAVD